MASNHLVLLPETTFAAAVTAVTTTARPLPSDTVALAFMLDFNYGAGGTDITFWVQTSIDNENWSDIASFNVTTAAIVKVAAVNSFLAHTHATATDGSLADNTVANGFIGSYIRVKYTSTGTYSGATNAEITCVAKKLTDRQ